ncbi:MAG: TrkA family potassium uptake protein [Desulfurococcales archaeon]|nr:TrkA family potassium uptake protein [Desulfurococcales archaeon]
MRILVIGVGEMGKILAKRLSEIGHSVTVVDKDEDRVVAVSDEADVMGIVRDATDPRLYEELDMSSFDVVVAATDRDEVNLFVAAIARMYRVPRVFVRVRNPETARLLNMLGIEGVIAERQIAANIMYSYIQGYYSIVELIPALQGEFLVVSGVVRSTSPLRGKSIREAEKMIPRGARLLLVYYEGEFRDPREVAYLEEGMMLIFIARKDVLREVAKLL